jgi:hypothetical protein
MGPAGDRRTIITRPPHPAPPPLAGLRRRERQGAEHLPAIRGILDNHSRKFEEAILRRGRVDREIANRGDFAGLWLRLDNLDNRVSRIERRLELSDAPSP